MERKIEISLDSEALDNAIEKANRLIELFARSTTNRQFTCRGGENQRRYEQESK